MNTLSFLNERAFFRKTMQGFEGLDLVDTGLDLGSKRPRPHATPAARFAFRAGELTDFGWSSSSCRG
jgi:hypothetical protein